MLILLPARRDKTGLFDMALRFDLWRDTERIGGVVHDRKQMRAELSISSEAFIVARLRDQPDEKVYQALGRLLTGGAKPAINPTALTTAAGEILALAEPAKGGYAVSHQNQRFSLRRPSFFSRPYHLYTDSNSQSLGFVGQTKFFSRRLLMDLPERFAPAFQVFLVVLLINLSFEQMDTST